MHRKRSPAQTVARLRALIMLALGGALLSLNGCASWVSAYNDVWECPKAKGDGPCESVSQSYLRATAKHALPAPPDPTRYTGGLTGTLPAGSEAPGGTPSAWVPPVKTVWVAPYVDTFGRRHEAQLLRIVVLSGKSSVRPEPEFMVPPVPETTEAGAQIGPPPPPAEPPSGNTTRQPNSQAQRERTVRPSASRISPTLPALSNPNLGGFSIPTH